MRLWKGDAAPGSVVGDSQPHERPRGRWSMRTLLFVDSDEHGRPTYALDVAPAPARDAAPLGRLPDPGGWRNALVARRAQTRCR